MLELVGGRTGAKAPEWERLRRGREIAGRDVISIGAPVIERP
jgi:hypothetical protein